MSENRKTKYVKLVLKDALQELLQEKDLERITIKELCATAELNRSTFYAHYEDIFQLFDEFAKEYMEKIPFSNDIDKKEIKESIDYMYIHKQIYIILLKRGKYHEYVLDKSMAYYDNYFTKENAQFKMNRDDFLVMVQYTCGGSENVILQVLTDSCKKSSEELSELICSVNEAVQKIALMHSTI